MLTYIVVGVVLFITSDTLVFCDYVSYILKTFLRQTVLFLCQNWRYVATHGGWLNQSCVLNKTKLSLQ